MTLHYLHSLRLEQFPSVILPLRTPLPVNQQTLTLTIVQMHSCFPALQNFSSSFYPGGRCRTTQSEIKQLYKRRLSVLNHHTGWPLTRVQNLSLRVSKLEKKFTDELATNTFTTAGIHSQFFSYMIKSANFKLVIQMLSFGRFLQ